MSTVILSEKKKNQIYGAISCGLVAAKKIQLYGPAFDAWKVKATTELLNAIEWVLSEDDDHPSEVPSNQKQEATERSNNE